MKTTLFALCILCATGAFAQGIAGATLLSNEPQVIEFASHNARATQTDMRMQQNLLGAASQTRAHGERPTVGSNDSGVRHAARRFRAHVEGRAQVRQESRHRLE